MPILTYVIAKFHFKNKPQKNNQILFYYIYFFLNIFLYLLDKYTCTKLF